MWVCVVYVLVWNVKSNKFKKLFVSTTYVVCCVTWRLKQIHGQIVFFPQSQPATINTIENTYMTLTSLAIIPSVIQGRANMQKTESYSEYELWNRWPPWGDYSRVALLEVSRQLTISGNVSISHDTCPPCHLDLIDTIMFKPLYVDSILL